MKEHSKTMIHVLVWIGSILIIVVLGVIYFPREFEEISFIESFYYTLRLFILEHDVPHFPKTPVLIFIYFLAPVISLSVAGTAITYLFRLSPALLTKFTSDHVIICGMGRTGKILASTLKKRNIAIVGVDLGPADSFDGWNSDNNIPMIFGDFHSKTILRKAGVEKARSVIFASGSDMANLEGAIAAYDCCTELTGPPRIIWTHISNEKLANTARKAVWTKGLTSIRYFDTYWIAASRMISNYFSSEIRKGIHDITILGFGKFGRDLTEVLICELERESPWTIRIVDVRDLEKEVRRLAQDHHVEGKIFFVRTAIQDLQPKGGEDKAFFICTDDDIGNLTVALLLASEMIPTLICVRMTTWPISAIAEHLGKNQKIVFVNLNELVVQGIEQLAGIFEPPQFSDLKRVRSGETLSASNNGL